MNIEFFTIERKVAVEFIGCTVHHCQLKAVDCDMDETTGPSAAEAF